MPSYQPAGVGIGRNPPLFLKEGDEIAITIPGIGTIRNKVTTYNATTKRLTSQSAFSLSNATRSVGATSGLTNINGKPLHYNRLGSGDSNIVFVHGLGGTAEYFTPLISDMGLQDVASLHLFDFEGHGLSPTHPLSVLTVDSLVADLAGVFSHAGITVSNPGTLIAQAMGCIIALKFALDNPGLVKKLVLLGPPSFPLPEATRRVLEERSELIRTSGMGAVVDKIVLSSTSEHTKRTNPLAVSAIRLSLLGQEPEAFAKACNAFARDGAALPVENLDVRTIIVTGSEDKVSSAEEYAEKIKGAETVVLPNVAQWHVFADVKGVSSSLKSFL
jgi:pimeloyl-ACP methyl ester carboxylesterase